MRSWRLKRTFVFRNYMVGLPGAVYVLTIEHSRGRASMAHEYGDRNPCPESLSTLAARRYLGRIERKWVAVITIALECQERGPGPLTNCL